MTGIFTKIYKDNSWNYLSGPGSSVPYNYVFIQFMRDYLEKHDVTSMVDLGCGDFRVTEQILARRKKIRYTGIDCVAFLIRMLEGIHKKDPNLSFECYDFAKEIDRIPFADLYLIKDVLQHWPNNIIHHVLRFLVYDLRPKHIIIVNDGRQKKPDRRLKEVGGYKGLSAKFLPLQKYNPKVILTYREKEVSVITNDPKNHTSSMEK